MTLPAGLSFLLEKLHSPQQAERNTAFTECAELIELLGHTTQIALGDNITENLADIPTAYARCHHTHLLRKIAQQGTWHSNWTNPTLAWWVQETDHHTNDDPSNPITEGAQLLTTLGQHTDVTARFLLAAIRKRITTPTSNVWTPHTYGAIATAATTALQRPGLKVEHATEWLTTLPQATPETSHPTPATCNTINTLHSVFLLLHTHHSDVMHADTITCHISQYLHTAIPELNPTTQPVT